MLYLRDGLPLFGCFAGQMFKIAIDYTQRKVAAQNFKYAKSLN